MVGLIGTGSVPVGGGLEGASVFRAMEARTWEGLTDDVMLSGNLFRDNVYW
jgi:hypothetical protein